MILKDSGEKEMVGFPQRGLEKDLKLRQAKKIGADSCDFRRLSQPRLPGSVVGEASMSQGREAGKIT